ncbi:MAG: WYL domain-containing protein [Clostridiales bacterium]|nr:WYL domain-containing protein [Clostridiales bacterium]
MLIKFDKSVKFRLIDEYGLSCFEEKEDCLMMNFSYDNKDYAFSWVMGFGDKAEVLEPKEAHLEFKRIIENNLKKYKK